jgi:putative ABC transport system permease protein
MKAYGENIMWREMQVVAADLRHGLFMLRKNVSFAVISALTLALGIGSSTAIFSVIDAVLLRPLPYKAPTRLVLVSNSDSNTQLSATSYTNFEAWKAQNTVFEDMAVYYRNSSWSTVTLSGEDPQKVQAGFVSASFFTVMGVSPEIGRVFAPEEESHGERVAVLSHRLWQQRFGASKDAVGKRIEVNGASFQIIGVMPSTFRFPAANVEFWVPITTNKSWLDRPVPDGSHTAGFYLRWNVIARLKQNATLNSVQAEMEVLNNRLQQDFPDQNKGLGIAVEPLSIEVNGNTRVSLLVLMSAVSLLLLIACSNVANLILARGASRSREMAMRSALGASRFRLIRQLLTENLVLAVVAGMIGVLFAWVGIRTLIAVGPRDIPRLSDAGLDASVLGFALGISLISTIIFGLPTGWKASRMDPMMSLKAGGTGSTLALGGKRMHGLLVICQFALAMVLVAGAGLLFRSFWAISSVDPGFQPDRVITFTVGGGKAAFYEQLIERLRAVPGVQKAGGIRELFELETPNTNGLRTVEGHEPEPRNRWTALTWIDVSGNYFQAMGIPLLRGRLFSDQDTPKSQLVAVIDESLARRYWPNEDPIGKRFKGQDPRGQNDDWIYVIGMVRDVRTHGLEKAPTPHVYLWYLQDTIDGGATPDLVVGAAGNPVQLMPALRHAVHSVEPRAVISKMATVQQEIDEQLWIRRFGTWLMGLFSLIALVLTSAGMYGQMQYFVAQRTREIGIRMALGSTRKSILQKTLWEGMSLALVGLGAGILIAVWLMRFLSSILYNVKATDVFTPLAGAVLLLLVAVAATLSPAAKAMRVNPLTVLRQE